MKNLGGHNFSYTRAVQRALEARGIPSEALVHRSFPADVAAECGYHPTFSLGSYDFPPGNGRVRDLRYVYAQSVVFADELQQALRERGNDEVALAFSHTV